MQTMPWIITIVLAAACFTDLRRRRIPNWLTIPFLLAGLIGRGTEGFLGLSSSLGGVALATVLFGVPCFFRLMGMGDYKLAAGVAAWIGFGQFLTAFILIAIIGGVMAGGYSLLHGNLGGAVDRMGDLLMFRAKARPSMGSESAKAHSIPYAPAIALGTLLSFLGK